MYDLIEQKRSVRKLYTESLIGRGDITVEEAEQALRDYQQQLERVFTETREADQQPGRPATGIDPPAEQASSVGSPGRRTAVDLEVVKRIADALRRRRRTASPCTRRLMPQLQRRAPRSPTARIDWGMGEILAFGSLLMEGRPVRLAGQDSRRGTFVSAVRRRSSTATTPTSGRRSRTSTEDQAQFYVYDSLLSEYAAMGFEYGYSVARPDALVLWEAQFGDFVNGAQTIIDEFISSGEQKWGQQSGVVLLLPHGYEGQGPDHSSARIERFLQMCAEDDIDGRAAVDARVVLPPAAPARRSARSTGR